MTAHTTSVIEKRLAIDAANGELGANTTLPPARNAPAHARLPKSSKVVCHATGSPKDGSPSTTRAHRRVTAPTANASAAADVNTLACEVSLSICASLAPFSAEMTSVRALPRSGRHPSLRPTLWLRSGLRRAQPGTRRHSFEVDRRRWSPPRRRGRARRRAPRVPPELGVGGREACLACTPVEQRPVEIEERVVTGLIHRWAPRYSTHRCFRRAAGRCKRHRWPVGRLRPSDSRFCRSYFSKCGDDIRSVHESPFHERAHTLEGRRRQRAVGAAGNSDASGRDDAQARNECTEAAGPPGPNELEVCLRSLASCLRHIDDCHDPLCVSRLADVLRLRRAYLAASSATRTRARAASSAK